MPQLIVTAVLVEGRSRSEVAREYRVSRRWVITLVQRYLAERDAGLVPRQRRPLTSPRQTPREVEDEIVAIRKELDRGSHEAGAATPQTADVRAVFPLSNTSRPSRARRGPQSAVGDRAGVKSE